MTSSMPGKTQLINHFLINDAWYLVDLPGYGYAQRGKEGREKIRSIIESYILNRYEMTCLFVLIDCRHEPQKIDVEFLEWLGENEIPFCIVFTKADKLRKMSRLIRNVCLKIGKNFPRYFILLRRKSKEERNYSIISGV